MKSIFESEKNDLKRRRRERYIIISLIVLISVLAYSGTQVFDWGLRLPISNSLLIFSLINFNVILLLFLLFLIVRNLVKLLFERKKRLMGAKLRSKLVLAFITLSLLPTIVLFFVSVQFISTSIEYWYNLPIERSLKKSLEIGQDYYKGAARELFATGNNLSRLITYHGYMLIARQERLKKYILEKRTEYRLDALRVFSQKLELRALSRNDRIDLSSFSDPSVDVLRASFEKGADHHSIESSQLGDLVSGIVPIFSRTESKAVVGLIVLDKFIPKADVNRLKALSVGYEEFKQLKMMKEPMKLSQVMMLAMAALLSFFLSVWFGFFLSKEMTIPIQEVAEGTRRIASGDYDFFIEGGSDDEIGVLVNSFNKMMLDLKNSKRQIEEANEELIKSNIEIEARRLYTEAVLENVAAGVVSADASGTILTINKSAEKMLNITAKNMIGKNYKDIIAKDQVKVVNEFLRDRDLLRKDFMQRQINFSIKDKTLTLLIYLNVLRDDQGRYVGLVAVFENLTEIERAQRMAAWREVARRIAHEVKNPLTPIQLSAQRLKKQYGDKLAHLDGKVFEECTDMIINQVGELKRLVNEFSTFARMPQSNPVPNDFREIIREAVSLYKEAERNVTITFNDTEGIPLAKVDKEQMKRVMINLLDNAIDAMGGEGHIVIDLRYHTESKHITVVVSDDGKGIPPESRDRLFEPYFSTKKAGTGLGLSIVSSIINEHKGKIEVQDGSPRGTRFIIELPIGV